MVCGKEFPSYHAAYMHIKRLHSNHPSMNRESYANENIPSAPLFGRNEAVRYEEEYYEPVRHERRHNENRDFDERKEKDNSGAIAIFIIGMVAVGVWLYFRYFKGKFNFWGLLASNEENNSNGEEPVHWIDNAAPVTKDGAYPVFHVSGEA